MSFPCRWRSRQSRPRKHPLVDNYRWHQQALEVAIEVLPPSQQPLQLRLALHSNTWTPITKTEETEVTCQWFVSHRFHNHARIIRHFQDHLDQGTTWQDFPEFCRLLQNLAKSRRISQNLAESCRILQNLAEFFPRRTSQNLTESRRISQILTEFSLYSI